MNRSPIVFVLCAMSFACGGDRAASGDTSEGALEGESNGTPECASWGGTETFDGLAGQYDDESTAPSELDSLEIGAIDEGDAHISSSATYKRERCAEGTCRSEAGKAQLLPDNAAFPTNMMLLPDGAESGDVFFVLGMKRSGAEVSRICLVKPVPTAPGSRPAPTVFVLARRAAALR